MWFKVPIVVTGTKVYRGLAVCLLLLTVDYSRCVTTIVKEAQCERRLRQFSRLISKRHNIEAISRRLIIKAGVQVVHRLSSRMVFERGRPDTFTLRTFLRGFFVGSVINPLAASFPSFASVLAGFSTD